MLKARRILFSIFCLSITILPVFSEETDYATDNFSDYVSDIIELFENNIHQLAETSNGTYDDGTAFTVYNAGEDIKLTVSIDENSTRYMVGNVSSNETMQKIIDLLGGIFSEPIPYLNSIVEDYKAAFYDSGSFYISNDLPDYLATFTILGSQLFVEEVRTQEKLIIQRQWCTPEYFDQCVEELGSGWGFLASWDPEPQVTPFTDNQIFTADNFVIYTVKPGDYLAKIAREYYGTSHLWGLIYELNKNNLPILNQPDLILPGMQLMLPSNEFIRNLSNWVQNN
jgi:hypothetical protein